MPSHFLFTITTPAEMGVNDEPEKILYNPKQHQTSQHFALKRPGPASQPQEGQVKGKSDERESPRVKSGEGTATHENVEEHMFFHAPCGKVLGPPMRAFNLNFQIGPNEGARHNRRKMADHAAK